MSAVRKDATVTPIRRPPSKTSQGRENQLVGLAVDLAEKQLMDGTASSQVITHYLKLASPREELDRERIRMEQALLRARVEQLASSARTEELYGNAIKAMSLYQGKDEEEIFD